MAEDVKTVQIVDPENKDDFVVINESEYDAEKHTLLEDQGGASTESSDGDSDPDVDPAVSALLDGTVEELKDGLPNVTDVDLLQRALKVETRSTAQEEIEDRIQDLS